MSFSKYLSAIVKCSVALILINGIGAEAVEAAEKKVWRIGPVDFLPSLSISEGYNDNVFFINSQKTGSWITSVNTALNFMRQWNRLDFNFSYALNHNHYDSFSQNDTTNHRLTNISHWVFNHRNRLDLNSSLCFCEIPIGVDLTQGTVVRSNSRPIQYTNQTYHATYTFGSAGAQGNLIFNARYSETSFDRQIIESVDQIRFRASTQNQYYILFSGTFLYKVMPKTSALVEVDHTIFKYNNHQINALNNNFSQTRYLFGATWKAAGKTTGTIKLGIYDLQYDDPNRVSNLGLTGSVSVAWQPWTYSGFTLTATQNNMPRLGIDTGSYINQKQFEIAWQHSWNPSLSHQVRLRGGTWDYVNTNPAISDTFIGVNLGLNYRMRSWLNLGFNYSYNRRDSNRNSYIFDQNIIMMTVNVSL